MCLPVITSSIVRVFDQDRCYNLFASNIYNKSFSADTIWQEEVLIGCRTAFSFELLFTNIRENVACGISSRSPWENGLSLHNGLFTFPCNVESLQLSAKTLVYQFTWKWQTRGNEHRSSRSLNSAFPFRP